MPLPNLQERASGLLLHPTSLPGPHGCGDLGASARRFVDLLGAARQRWWQMLPVGPVGYGNSPYSAHSAFAGSTLLIDLDALVEERLLAREQLAQAVAEEALPSKRVDYQATNRLRDRMLRAAFATFTTRAAGPHALDLEEFVEREKRWLEDFALYAAIKKSQGHVQWTLWPAPLRSREEAALERARVELREEISFHRFAQWLFHRQWNALRSWCEERSVALIGDVPIFVAHDSADVWSHPELFQLDRAGQPTVVAGVPPDYFSRTGQRWGNPLYRWDALKETGYAWWIDRLRSTLARFDAVRLDHFIGFERYWQIPASCPTAVEGSWQKGPSTDFFTKVQAALGALPLIAEDLGAITPEVKALRDRFELPGIRILQFAFGADPSAPEFRPHHYPRRCAAYTGTHDNDTTAGWFSEQGGGESTRSPEQAAKERAFTVRYLASDGREIHWDLIRGVEASVANLAIVPLQDVLGLGDEARMNRPGTAEGNWEWRCEEGAFGAAHAARLALLCETYDR